jgi:diguanylate cyclase (GGDEF)-like protein
MLPRFRNALLALLIPFFASFAALVTLYHHKAEQYALGEAEKLALNALLVHRATHEYVVKFQRPEIYRLKAEGALYEAYFSPILMSRTFISRNINEFLNAERAKRGLVSIHFKLATDNPRNPINKADAIESGLLKRMNEEGLQEYKSQLEINGEKWLYLALPIERSDASCMRCHSAPAIAPTELIEMYGDQAGFHEKPNAVRAMISIRAPMKGVNAAASAMANMLSGVTFLILSAIYGLIALFVSRIDKQERKIISQNDELETVNLKLAELSMTDALTGLANRRSFDDTLTKEWARAARTNQEVGVIMLDVDWFKKYNDHYGHLAGDECLRSVAHIIHDIVRRAGELPARYGGEEFAVVLANTDISKARTLAESICRAVHKAGIPHALSPYGRVSVSIGVVVMRAVIGNPPSEALQQADQAMYRAKEAGRNRVETG